MHFLNANLNGPRSDAINKRPRHLQDRSLLYSGQMLFEPIAIFFYWSTSYVSISDTYEEYARDCDLLILDSFVRFEHNPHLLKWNSLPNKNCSKLTQ